MSTDCAVAMMPSDAATRSPPRYTNSFRLLPKPSQRSATCTPPGLLSQTPAGRLTVRSNRSHGTDAHSGTSPPGAASRKETPDQKIVLAGLFRVAADPDTDNDGGLVEDSFVSSTQLAEARRQQQTPTKRIVRMINSAVRGHVVGWGATMLGSTLLSASCLTLERSRRATEVGSHPDQAGLIDTRPDRVGRTPPDFRVEISTPPPAS